MDWLDTKYINLLSLRLERFKRVQNNYNFRCPICLDSQKTKVKARGWLLNKNGKTRYYCHNCNASLTFKAFLKHMDYGLYSDYITESISDTKAVEPEYNFAKPIFKAPKLNLKKISQLEFTHPARGYIDSRLIPTKEHHRLYFTTKFKKWVNTILPNKFESLEYDEPRLVLPLLDSDGEVFGFQGRSFKKKSTIKYITILLNEDMPKLFGLDQVDFNYTTYVTEGPIDSLFIPNCLASCGGRLDTNLSKLNIDKSKFVLIYDNEPRNVETVQKMSRAISDGYKLCIWPPMEQKDINDMILSGLTKDQVKYIIDRNIYCGLDANLKLIEWKKCHA